MPAYLIAASAAVVLLLGSVHLLYTFHGNKLMPRDEGLVRQMQEVHPVLTRETTIWRAWIGFNASHSTGAMCFGLVYGYLALAQPAVLFGSPFLMLVGAVMLAGYVALGRYWFSIPNRGIAVAAVLYAAGVVASRVVA